MINEVNCEGRDWVELANTSSTPARVGGWTLTDDPPRRVRSGHRYVLPARRSIPAHGFLTVHRTRPGKRGLPFGVACGEDTIRLTRSRRTRTSVDAVRVPKLSRKKDTWGRYRTGTGRFEQTARTLGRANEPSSAPDLPPPDNSWLFDPTTVHELALTLPPASQAALAAATKDTPKQYVPATLRMRTSEASYGPYPVGVRLKGDSSFRPLTGKAAFKVDLDTVKGRRQRVHGLGTLTLNNMVDDPSMVHETIAYEAFRALDLPAPRAGYAFVTVNGQAFGLYANVETIDEDMLRRWPATFRSTRHLFEGATGADATPERADDLELDEGDPARLQDLRAFVGALANTAAPYSQRLAAVADLEQLTSYWAAEKYLGQPDGYTSGRPNNFFLHSDDAGTFRMLPWGLDRALTERLGYGPREGRGGRLFNACLEEPACKQRYLTAVAGVRGRLSKLGLDNRVDRLSAVVRPWRERDPRRETPSAEADAQLAEARGFLVQRPFDRHWATAPDGQVVLDPGIPAQP